MSAVTGTTQRITSLFSGMDTDALVKSMVMGQQNKLDLLNGDKTKAEWKRDEYTDLNNQLRLFKEKFASVLGETNMLSKSAYVDFSINMATNNSLKVTATSAAKVGNYSVKIDQVAKAASMTGNQMSIDGKGLPDASVNKTEIGKLQAFEGLVGADGTFTFTINDVDFSFKSTDSLKTVMDTVNKSKAGATMGYSQISDRFTIASKETVIKKALRTDDLSVVVSDETVGFPWFVLNGSDGSVDVYGSGVYFIQKFGIYVIGAKPYVHHLPGSTIITDEGASLLMLIAVFIGDCLVYIAHIQPAYPSFFHGQQLAGVKHAVAVFILPQLKLTPTGIIDIHHPVTVGIHFRQRHKTIGGFIAIR